jgi:hypothetical protein
MMAPVEYLHPIDWQEIGAFELYLLGREFF